MIGGMSNGMIIVGQGVGTGKQLICRWPLPRIREVCREMISLEWRQEEGCSTGS
jgi:hypothetical protein